jgi:fermentation-respiration switch protein FrsA (DUF1100 family)
LSGSVPISFWNENTGAKLVGNLFTSQLGGEGKQPCIVFLHGFPGKEKNHDLAEALSYCGFSSLVFHYQGSWGSEGYYSFYGIKSDFDSALSYLLKEWQNAVDPKKIALLGYSMGGGLAIQFGAEDKRVCGVAALSPYSFEKDWEKPETSNMIIEAGTNVLKLSDNPNSLLAEAKSFLETNRPIDVVSKISPRPLLLIHGMNDNFFSVESSEGLFRKAGKPKRFIGLEGADHDYTGKRHILCAVLAQWFSYVFSRPSSENETTTAVPATTRSMATNQKRADYLG